MTVFTDIFPAGYTYCLAYGQNSPNTLLWVSSPADMLTAGQTLEQNGKEVWFAFAGFDGTGQRKGENVGALQTLIADIDVDTEQKKGGYATFDEALAALVNATRGRLPAPTHTIMSGGGLHCYWQLEQPIGTGYWMSLQSRLLALFREIDPRLVCDPSCFGKPAGVLRFPGHHNFKYDPPRPVTHLIATRSYTLEAIEHALPQTNITPLRTAVPALPAGHAGPRLLALPRSQVDGGVIRESCAVFRAYENDPALWENHDGWWSLMAMTAYMDDGARHAVEISAPYLATRPDSKRNPLTKHYEAVAKADADKAGPMACALLCDKVGVDYATTCAGCPLFNRGGKTSPVQLPGELALLSTVAPITYPVGQFEEAILAIRHSHIAYGNAVKEFPQMLLPGANQRYWVDTATCALMTTKPDPVNTGHVLPAVITKVAFWPVAIAERNADTVEWICAAAIPTQQGPIFRMFKVDPGALAIARDAVKALKRAGVNLPLANAMLLQGYLDYLCEWGARTSQTRYRALGWLPDRFVCGAFSITDKGQIVEADISGDARAAIQSKWIDHKGSLAAQIEALRIYETHGSDAARWATLIPFASILFNFIGSAEVAGIVHLSGPSGVGKTSLQRWMSSIFGAPLQAQMTVRDTTLSVDNVLGGLNHLPAILDELTEADASFMKNFAFKITGGRSNNARKSDGSGDLRVDGRTWQLILITSANKTFAEALSEAKDMSTDQRRAQLNRVMQLTLDEATIPKTADWQGGNAIHRVNDILLDNYGMLGPAFVQEVLSRREQITKRVRGCARQLMALYSNSDVRVQVAVIAAVMVANEILVQKGWWNVPTFWVEKYGHQLVGETKTAAAQVETTPAALIAGFVAKHYSGFEKRLPNGVIVPAQSTTHGLTGVDYGVTQGLQRYALVVSVLTRYLKDAGVNFPSFVKDALREGVLEPTADGTSQHSVVPSMVPICVPCLVARIPAAAAQAPAQQSGGKP